MKLTYNYEEIFENIDNDDEDLKMNIPEDIAEKIGLTPGDSVRILLGDQGTILLEKVTNGEK